MAVIRCQDCGQTVAEIRGSSLVIRQRHHGREHFTVLSLSELAAIIEKANRQPIDTLPVLQYSHCGKSEN